MQNLKVTLLGQTVLLRGLARSESLTNPLDEHRQSARHLIAFLHRQATVLACERVLPVIEVHGGTSSGLAWGTSFLSSIA